MNIKKMSLEELEKLSHLDIAYNILKYNKKTMTTVELLREICEMLNYSEGEYNALIGDFYTSLNLDKRFLLIDGKWDLSENHSVKIVVEDELDEDLEEYEELDEEEETEEIEDEVVADDVEALEEPEEDELEDLTIVEEDELEEDIL